MLLLFSDSHTVNGLLPVKLNQSNGQIPSHQQSKFFSQKFCALHLDSSKKLMPEVVQLNEV